MSGSGSAYPENSRNTSRLKGLGSHLGFTGSLSGASGRTGSGMGSMATGGVGSDKGGATGPGTGSSMGCVTGSDIGGAMGPGMGAGSGSLPGGGTGSSAGAAKVTAATANKYTWK